MENYNINIPVSTNSGNNYFLCGEKKQLLFIHPICMHFIRIYQFNQDVFKEYTIVKETNIINGILYSGKDVDYYFNKFSFLKMQGFFEKTHGYKKLISSISPEAIFNSLVDTNQLLFEVTEVCNLKCYYCAYGELYNNNPIRKFNTLNIKHVNILVEYMVQFWEKFNPSENRIINIYFYGGEPLTNIKLIKEIVFIFDNLSLEGVTFKYGLTTNGLLLKKNIDFLNKHDFNLTISIDGNKENNIYRRYSSGINCFDDLINQIDYIKKKYRTFFNKNISFISVLHNKNNIQEIDEFLFTKYNKTSYLSELSQSEINENKIEEFNHIFRNNFDNINEKECFIYKNKKHGIKKDILKRLILLYNLGLLQSFSSVFSMFFNKRLMTGTCVPFSKKIYISSIGYIYPCERIDYKHSLGFIDIENNKVCVDFTKIANKYNILYEKLYECCANCYCNQLCSKCAFHIKFNQDQIKCNKFLSEDMFLSLIRDCINFIEEKPYEYLDIMNKFQSII